MYFTDDNVIAITCITSLTFQYIFRDYPRHSLKPFLLYRGLCCLILWFISLNEKTQTFFLEKVPSQKLLRLNPTVGFCRIWLDSVRFGRIWSDSVTFGRIWSDLVGFGRIWSDLVGFGRIWSDLVGFGRI